MITIRTFCYQRDLIRKEKRKTLTHGTNTD